MASFLRTISLFLFCSYISEIASLAYLEWRIFKRLKIMSYTRRLFDIDV